MDNYILYESNSADETFKIASRLSKDCIKGSIYLLNGELGVGKTVFAKGFAHGLSVEANITSPTFTLLNIYNGRLPFYHFDLYRLQHDVHDQGFEEYFFSNGVCLIEWGKYALDIIKNGYITINIKKNLTKGENYRIVEILTK